MTPTLIFIEQIYLLNDFLTFLLLYRHATLYIQTQSETIHPETPIAFYYIPDIASTTTNIYY